jgi:hypothetical protein
MEPITPLTRMQVCPDVLFSQVGDEAVLLNVKSGVYYSLDRVGALVWGGIVGGESLGEIQLSLHRQFAVEFDVIWPDVAALVADMAANGLRSDDERKYGWWIP